MLSKKTRYLQIALNNTLKEAYSIINQIPVNRRILIEAGTPLIKRYGERGIAKIKAWYSRRILSYYNLQVHTKPKGFLELIYALPQGFQKPSPEIDMQQKYFEPYVVADLKTMDRGFAEVDMAKRAGANAAVALGSAPKETLNAFIQKCDELGLDAMIDMMNVEFPLTVLRQLKRIPPVVILHRGVDEEYFNKESQIPFHEIRRIKSNYNILISIAGGDTLREAQRAVFNDADIVVVWKSFYKSSKDTAELAQEFLKEIK